MLAESSKRQRVPLLSTHHRDEDSRVLTRALANCERVESFQRAIPKQETAGFAAALIRSWLSSLPATLWRCRVPALERQVQDRLASGSVEDHAP